jgi:hypothetical protein
MARSTQPGLRSMVRQPSAFAQKSRTVLTHLIIVNVFMVMLDIALLVTEFLGLFEVQVLYKVRQLNFLFAPALTTRNRLLFTA